MQFVIEAIREHKNSPAYNTAADAELYYKHQNPTIMRYQKFLFNHLGQRVPDIWSPNNKIASNWYFYFTTQAVLYLLGNGVSFADDKTRDMLGEDFDNAMIEAATAAKNGGVSFGFWNFDHVEVFPLTEFVPLWDEEDGLLKAGIRFWQIEDSRPLRATLFEMDGYTEYIKRKNSEMQVLHEKRTYTSVKNYEGDKLTTVEPGANYDGFPIVPLWNINKQSDLVGTQGTIDAYDLMVSGLINNVSEGEFVYWVLKNCGGMDETEDAQFIEQLKLTHVAHADGDDGASVESQKISVPFEASGKSLEELRQQLFDDFMVLNVSQISGAPKTAKEISAAYEPLNQKTDLFEAKMTTFIKEILRLARIKDKPTYTRSQISNQSETLDMTLSSSEYLDDEYMTKKILTILGDVDEVDAVMKRKAADSAARYIDIGAGEGDNVND